MKKFYLFALTLLVSIYGYSWTGIQLGVHNGNRDEDWNHFEMQEKGNEVYTLFRVTVDNPEISIAEPGKHWWGSNGSNIQNGIDYNTKYKEDGTIKTQLGKGNYIAYFTPSEGESKIWVNKIDDGAYGDMKLTVNRNGKSFSMSKQKDNENRDEYFCEFDVYDENPTLFISGVYNDLTATWGTGATVHASNDSEKMIFIYNDGFKTDLATGRYTIYFRPADGNVWIVRIGDVGPKEENPVTEVTGQYYFYGDMNDWSSLKNAGWPYRVYSYDDKYHEHDLSAEVFKGRDVRHVSDDELRSKWMFKRVTNSDAHQGYRDFLGSGWDGWYVFDLANIADGGRRGRLCGQFKITMGDHDNENCWGLSGEHSVDYYKKVLKTGSANELKLEKNVWLQNIQLDDNYVENAVLYFHPGNKVVKVQGTGHQIYVYYAHSNGEAVSADVLETEMIVESQLNYLVNDSGYNGEEDFVNVGGNDGGAFRWEAVTNVEYRDKTYANALRRRIPTGATHRSPTEINVQTFRDDEIDYPAARVLCDNIWYIKPVAENYVYFRYDDDLATQSLDWVSYNVFNYTYNKNNMVEKINYLFGGTREKDGDQPSITSGQYAVMQLVQHQNPADNQAYWWWKSPMPIPSQFASGSWVIFGESRGGVYPVERIDSDDEALGNVQLDGHDLYYVATTRETPSLLYSHLNGTYSKTANTSDVNKTIQINAEMYDPETLVEGTEKPVLVTGTDEVKYRYEIYYNGRLVACNDASGAFHSDDEATLKSNYGAAYTTSPFFNWELANTESKVGDNTESGRTGYYFIVVKAEYNGKIYTAQDTYAVYD